MNATKELWARCWKAAETIVEGHRLPFEAYNFDIGGSESQGSTAFSRRGTTNVQKSFTLPSDLSALISQMYQGSQLPSATTGNESNLLNTLLTQSSTGVPGLSTLQEAQGIDPLNYSGLSGLSNMAARNPYSSDYESAVGSLYDRMFSKGRALAQSGPANVRGGTARQGFELAELDANVGRHKFQDIRQQQDKEAGVVQQAIQMMNAIENMRRGSRLQGQGQQMAGEHSRKQESLQAASGVNAIRGANNQNVALASDLLGTPKQTTTDNVRGRGQQVTQQSNWGAGITCCFIFLEVLNGELPPVVRKGRDTFNTDNRTIGYRWMSSWLVPLMRKFVWTRKLVNFFIVKPFIVEGEWWFDGKRVFAGHLLFPYCWAWLLLWSFIGCVYGKLIRHHLVPAV